MTRLHLYLCGVALTSCAPVTPPHTALPPPAHLLRAEPPEPSPAPLPAAAHPSAATTKATSAATTKATKEYDKAERQEVPAINATVANGTATAASVDRIHQADLAARAAVRKLASQDGHPTERAIAEALRTVLELIAATEATP